MKVARPGVGILIINNGKVLLGLRNEDPEKADTDLHGEGTWTCPGGKVDFGETVLSAAKRETKEETGLILKNPKIFCVTDEIIPDAHYVTIGFMCTAFDGELQLLEPTEIVEWKWFAFNEIPENMYSPSKKMIHLFLQKEIYDEVL